MEGNFERHFQSPTRSRTSGFVSYVVLVNAVRRGATISIAKMLWIPKYNSRIREENPIEIEILSVSINMVRNRLINQVLITFTDTATALCS